MGAIAEFDGAAGAAEAWVHDLQHWLKWEHSDRVYLALLAALHALRDHLPADEAVRLGASLPPLLRGLYYEGWHPPERSPEQCSREEFFTRIHEGVHRDPGIDPE
jgi:uncharacterized protein (DUF2267 family)